MTSISTNYMTPAIGHSLSNSTVNHHWNNNVFNRNNYAESLQTAEDISRRYKEFAEHMQKRKERDEKFVRDRKRLRYYAILMIPFFVFPKETAAYFVAAKLVKMYLQDMGVSNEKLLIFLFIMTGVDAEALRKGRLHFVPQFKQRWYVTIYDYALTKVNASDLFRVGTDMLLTQYPRPEYGTFE